MNKSRSRLAVAICLALAVALPIPAMAQEKKTSASPAAAESNGKAKLVLRVRGDQGKTAVAGAVVEVRHLDTGKTYSSPPTNAKGECELTGLPFGYVDLGVQTKDGTFVGNQVVNVPPAGTVLITFNLTKYSEHPATWWNGRQGRQGTPTGGPATGVAEIRTKVSGRDFWKTPAGIAVIAGGSGAVLLAIASGGGSSQSSVSPSTP